MRKPIYPGWFDVACSECGTILSIYCFYKKDRCTHAHFCEDKECLQTFYRKKYGEGRKSQRTIARLLYMRKTRNQRIEELLSSDDDDNDYEEVLYDEPDLELMKRIKARDEEYRMKLRQHFGLSV